jgi:hypothetical protein
MSALLSWVWPWHFTERERERGRALAREAVASGDERALFAWLRANSEVEMRTLWTYLRPLIKSGDEERVISLLDVLLFSRHRRGFRLLWSERVKRRSQGTTRTGAIPACMAEVLPQRAFRMYVRRWIRAQDRFPRLVRACAIARGKL